MGLDISLLTSRASEGISHNYVDIAKALGVYYPIWRGDMYGIRYAEQLIPFLEMAENLLADNDIAKELSPLLRDKNFDSLEEFGGFIYSLKRSCEEHPSALLQFSR